jgi:hypothetical protein
MGMVKWCSLRMVVISHPEAPQEATIGAEGVTDEPRACNVARERDSQCTWVSRRARQPLREECSRVLDLRNSHISGR